MALTLGTNVGFVTSAPVADPAGSDTTIDGSSVVVKHTTPSNAVRITEIGWYRGSGTNTANFEVALYSDSAGVADARLQVDATNSSSSGGWITTAVDWAVDPSTDYWLGLQMDAHTGSSTVDSATSGGAGIDSRTSQTTLNNPYGGGAVADADGMYAIYALVETNDPPTVALNSPADASSDTDTTPTFDFTGTDVDSNDIRYNLQILSSAPDTAEYNTDTDLGSAATGTSLTANVTIGNNPNRILLVGVATDTSGGTHDVNSVTYDGVALTQIADSAYGGNKHSEMWYLLDPPVGTASCVVNTDNAYISAVAYDIHGVDQSDPFAGTPATHVGDNTAISGSITTDEENALIVDFVCSDNANLLTSDGTLQYSKDYTFNKARSSTRQATSTGSYTQTYSSSPGNGDWAMCIVALNNAETVLLNKVSGTDAGFANPDVGGDTDPFTSGENIQFTVQAGDALAAGTYYWRVRGKDPSGSNTYGAWSSARSFEVTDAGADLSINKSDSITVTESKNALLTSHVNVSESISVSETVTKILLIFISVSDSISVSESLTLLLTAFINKSESISITESATVFQPFFAVTVSDSVGVAEQIKAEQVSYISVSDSISVSEALSADIASTLAVSEGISVTEDRSVELKIEVSKSDSVSTAESVSLDGVPNPSVSDSVSVVESASVALQVSINASDSIAVQETSAVYVGTEINKSDSVSVAEAISVLIPTLLIGVSDSISVAESVGRDLSIAINVSDSISAAESVSTDIQIPRSAEVNDSITLSESVALLMSVATSVSESIAVSESVQPELNSFINKNDSISVSENKSVAVVVPPLETSTSDTVYVSESVGFALSVPPWNNVGDPETAFVDVPDVTSLWTDVVSDFD